MKKSLIVLALILVFALAGCQEKKQDKAVDKSLEPKSFPKAHSITKKEERKMLNDARRDLDIIMKVKDDTAPLAAAMTGEAQKEMIRTITADKAAGRVKVRRYSNLKLTLRNYTKGIGGVTASFIDKTYVIDAKTDRIVVKPTGKDYKVLLALRKTGGRWKIIRMLSTELKDKKAR